MGTAIGATIGATIGSQCAPPHHQVSALLTHPACFPLSAPCLDILCSAAVLSSIDGSGATERERAGGPASSPQSHWLWGTIGTDCRDDEYPGKRLVISRNDRTAVRFAEHGISRRN
eukprot:4222375-Pyramimonas_sp.AAC.1